MVIFARNLKKRLEYLIIKLAKFVLFIGLLYLGGTIINPESFISLDATERFAKWESALVSQEDFDDLWVLTWVVFSLLTAIFGYIAIMKLIKKIRGK